MAGEPRKPRVAPHIAMIQTVHPAMDGRDQRQASRRVFGLSPRRRCRWQQSTRAVNATSGALRRRRPGAAIALEASLAPSLTTVRFPPSVLRFLVRSDTLMLRRLHGNPTPPWPRFLDSGPPFPGLPASNPLAAPMSGFGAHLVQRGTAPLRPYFSCFASSVNWRGGGRGGMQTRFLSFAAAVMYLHPGARFVHRVWISRPLCSLDCAQWIERICAAVLMLIFGTGASRQFIAQLMPCCNCFTASVGSSLSLLKDMHSFVHGSELPKCWTGQSLHTELMP
jgi:hypothetical protein